MFDFNNKDFLIFVFYPICFFLLFYIVNIISYFKKRNNEYGALNQFQISQYKKLLFISFIIFFFIIFTGVIFSLILFDMLNGKSDLISINLKYSFLSTILLLLLVKNVIFNKFINFSIINRNKINLYLAYTIVIISIIETPEIIFLSYIMKIINN